MAGLAKLDKSMPEGHGGPDDQKASVSRGTFMPVGTYAPLSQNAIGVNKKSGTTQGGEEKA